MTDCDVSDAARIRELFGVRCDVDDDDGCGGRISPAANAENTVVNLAAAKKYLASTRLMRSGQVQKLYCRTSEVYERLMELRDSVERESCAALNFTIADPSNDLPAHLPRRKRCTSSTSSGVVEIAGSEDCVATALAMVHKSFGRKCFTVADSRLKRPESEEDDSSYDSDHEEEVEVGAITEHDEVSRTVSDTLGAEFAEYVVGGGNNSDGVDSTVGKSLSPYNDNNEYDPTYTSRVEFAIKLGYTEWQVQVALHKLGPKPEQNELLAELIKLGATNSGPMRDEHHLGGVVGAVCGRRSSADEGESSSSAITEAIADFRIDEPEPRPIVIDGSNVAMSHGNKDVFSCRGIKLCVDWFRARSHNDITVFVPMWRKEASRPDALIKDQDILLDLEREGLLVFTPSRQMGGRRVACHDDRYVLRLAAETDGVVVSNDNYRDLAAENPVFKRVVEERLLMFSFANDRFMPPDDPLGRHGPSLDAFLRIPRSSHHPSRAVHAPRQQTSPKPPSMTTSGNDLPPPCPYGKKCTYGNKCKYYHPERGSHPHKSVCEQLAEQAKINIQEVKSRRGLLELKAVLSSPLPTKTSASKTPLARTRSLVPSTTSLPPDVAKMTPHNWSDQLSTAKQLLSDPQPPSNDDQQLHQQQQQSGGNCHRKLERQLTFNPVFDPRLVHLMNQMESGSSGHVPLGVRHSGGGGAGDMLLHPPSSNSQTHQSVTRIASAPDSYRQWCPPPPPHHHAHHLQRTISTSDTQLHYHHQQQQQQQHFQHQFSGAAAAAAGFHHHPFQGGPSVSGTAAPPFGYLPQQGFPHPPPTAGLPPPPRLPMFQSNEEQRYRLYYHLSSLFPEDQVRAAMEKHPHETDPQDICAAIFAMFPKASSSGSSSSSSSSAAAAPKSPTGACNIPSTFQQQPR